MSYIKEIGDLEFTFWDEESYLSARLEYLNSGMANPFTEFLSQEMYDKDGCVVVSWKDSISANYVDFSIDTSNTLTYTHTFLTPQATSTLTIQDINDAWETLSDTNTLPIGDAYDAISDTNTLTMWSPSVILGMYNGNEAISISSNPCGEIPIKDFKSEKKNVINEEPIDSRFDILDL